MSTLTQNNPVTYTLNGVSSVDLSFFATSATPDYSYAAGGVVQWSTAQVCAWCGTTAGDWQLYWNKTDAKLTVDFGQVWETVYLTLYPTHGTTAFSLANPVNDTAPVPVPAAGALLGGAMLMAVIAKRILG